MVSSTALIAVIADKLRQYGARNIVVDPVMVATSGARLISEEAVDALKEKLLPHFHLIERAENAFRANGVEPQCVPIRGGTDGARLSWDGLPCPNLSTGGYNYHGVREWIPADSLEAMTNVLVTLTESFAE